MKYYAAYGSNLNLGQMALRCPGAKPLGTAWLNGWRLLFKGSKTGAYLTIERCEGSKVPVGVWTITDHDEKSLDRYEGYPDYYQKLTVPLKVKLSNKKTKEIEALIYKMPDDAKLGIPTKHYLETCLLGYMDFGIRPEHLAEALNASRRRR